MALIVEDGSGKPDAESYVSVEDADAYFADRGSPSTWADLTIPLKESALRYATQWLDALNWVGTIRRFSPAQALAWPRVGVTDSFGRIIAIDEIPERVKGAECERALAHVSEAINSGFSSRVTTKEKVGPIEVEYSDGVLGAEGPSNYPYILRLLKPLLGASNVLYRA